MKCWGCTCGGREGAAPMVVMFAPDGKRVPGLICRDCAEKCVAEYREKLAEEWSFEEVST